MKRLQAYQFLMEPNGEQQRAMRRIAGSCRYVWNKALALQIENHKADEKFIHHFAMCKWLPVWEKEPDSWWLKDTPSQLFQGVIKELARAYKNLLDKRADFPAFKKKTGGIDVGITRFATMSDASFIASLNSFKKHQKHQKHQEHQKRLARYQRRISRKVKFSNNWKKEKAKVQKVHTAIANTRKDFLNKTPTTISQNHALVCIEDLQVGNMSRSSAIPFSSGPGGCQNGDFRR